MRLGTLLAPDLKQILKEDPEEVRVLLEEIHAEDLADLIAELDPHEAAALLSRMKVEDAASIFTCLEGYEQEGLVPHMQPEFVAHIASEMASDVRADLFRVLPEEIGDQLLRTLECVDPEAAEDVRIIEKWPETSAGHLMTTSYLSASPAAKVEDVVAAIRAHSKEGEEPPFHIYMVDEEHHLQGSASVCAVLLASPEQPFSSVLSAHMMSVPPEMDQEDVARQMARYDLNIMPVVDERGVLLGVITVDDIIDVLTQEQTEDVQKIGGVEPLEVPYFHTTFWQFIRKRAVWLIVLFCEEFFTQTALRYYDPIFEAIKGASYYIPLLISAGGNSGSQSATLVIRGLSVGEIGWKDWWRIFLRETAMGVVLGTILGMLGFVRVLMYKDQHVPFALTIGLSLVGIVATGCTVGSMLPMVLRRLGFDPAMSSTPFIASLVDVLGIIVFAQVANWIMTEVIMGVP
ncbi:magnesium transporter [Pajaroellobacter abortibovis]|uniref:Magnesium transporter MgtE n=1 Tax=Pajaroellobacter abortibovis TaxID=1882918 RepID=A0A1L6MW02_9BACT|nr:magnesium transporter [Pajaroellobacter abortibovis]APR99595.1 magnesium transporter [Pajaroellobacter abortibovis]